MRLPSVRLAAAVLTGLVLLALAITDSQPTELLKTRATAQGVAADRAFVELMVPLDRRAIALARIARSRGEHAALRRTARTWVRKREIEINQLLRAVPPIQAQVPAGAVPPLAQGRADSGGLGLVPFDAGLGVRSADLEHRKQIDQALLNRMVRLAQGTIRVARAELSGGSRAGLKRVAKRALWGRFEQVFRLNAWYVRWYGRPSRAGGIPAGA